LRSCGPGAAAKEVARRVGPRGDVLAVDRSKLAIDQLVASASDLIAAGRLSVRNVSFEELAEWPHAELAAELAGVGLAPKTGHGGGIDVGGQDGGCSRGVVEGVDLGGDGLVLRP
jgi:hypothetical protein